MQHVELCQPPAVVRARNSFSEVDAAARWLFNAAADLHPSHGTTARTAGI